MLFIIQRLIKLSAAADFNLVNAKKDGHAFATRLILLDKPLCRCFPGLSVPGTAGRLWGDAGTWDLAGNGMNVEAGRGANARDCGNLRSHLVWKLSIRKKKSHSIFKLMEIHFCYSVFSSSSQTGRTMTLMSRRQRSG